MQYIDIALATIKSGGLRSHQPV